MQGHTHALSGALLWLGATPAVTALAGPLSNAEVAAGALACAGAALLPDCDHPQGTIAHSVGPLSQAACKVIEVVSGGHRQATHSFLFTGVAFALSYGAAYRGNTQILSVLFFVLAAFALRALTSNSAPRSREGGSRRSRPSPMSWGTSAAVAAGLTYLAARSLETPWPWLAPAVLIGVVAHLIGDALTPGGVPFFWPYRKKYAMPIVTHTGDVLEWALSGLMFVGVVFLARDQFAGSFNVPFV